jgi:hypothetical protein
MSCWERLLGDAKGTGKKHRQQSSNVRQNKGQVKRLLAEEGNLTRPEEE